MNIARWIIRLASTLLVLFFLTFLFGEGPPVWGQLTPRERLMFLGWGGSLAGLVLAWKWQGWGGLLTLLSFGGMAAAGPGILRNPFFLAIPVLGAAHLVCWWALYGQTTASSTRAIAVLLAGFGIFVLLAANEAFGMPPLMTPALRITPALQGTWQGQDVVFVISAPGTVSGKVGAEEVREGRILRNRSWFGSLLHWRTEFLVRGRAGGAPFTAPLNPAGATLRGSLFVSGRGRRLELCRIN